MLGFTLWLVLAIAQQPPVPQPFPKPGNAQPPRPAPTAPVPPPAAGDLAPLVPVAPVTPPTAAALGVPIYPGAQFIATYDAGRGQQFHLFGTTALWSDLVAYYRKQLNKGGDLVFDAPATYEFLVGRFREETMAYPPGVTIKEFKSAISEGYPNPKPGGQPPRFPTIIQIVPVPAGER